MMSPTRRLLHACALLIAVVVIATTSTAAPLRVRVRGAAKISARGWREQSASGSGIDLVLSGTLNDDAGEAMPNTSVAIRVVRETDAHDARVAQNLRAAHTCSRTTSGIRIGGSHDAPEVIATTDEAGRFCFRAPFDPDRYKATVVYAAPPGRPLVDAGEREISFDLSRRGLSLRFDPVPKILDIDTPRTTIEAVALHDDDETPRVAAGLAVTLANEKGDLANATTDGSGRARFAVAGNKLGPPGAGELRATFIGNTDIAGATSVEEVERHIKVQLKVPAADRNELKPMTPEDGIPLVATVTSSLGPIGEGSIEAWIGDVIVGAAPVVNGSAKLTLTFATSSNEAQVRLRYVPASPWFEPVGEPMITLPIKGPSIISKAPLPPRRHCGDRVLPRRSRVRLEGEAGARATEGSAALGGEAEARALAPGRARRGRLVRAHRRCPRRHTDPARAHLDRSRHLRRPHAPRRLRDGP